MAKKRKSETVDTELNLSTENQPNETEVNKEVEALTLINEQTFMLDIYVPKSVKIDGSLVKVFNEGYGDVFVHPDGVKVLPEFRVRSGEVKEYKEVNNLVFYAGCRPIIKVQQFK